MDTHEQDGAGRRRVLYLVLGLCVLFTWAGYLLKSHCIEDFNQRANRDLCYNDLQALWGLRMLTTVDGVTQKTLPYVNGRLEGGELRDGAIEYPVLTGVFMWVTAAPVDNDGDWLRFSALLLAPLSISTAYLLTEMSGRRALMWAAAPAIVLYSFHNWDLLVVASAALAFWLWWRGRPTWAAVWLGIGASFKMYPIFFLAPLVLERLLARDRKGAALAAGAGVGTAVLINLPFAIVNPDGWLATYLFHQRRGPNYDSIWNVLWPKWAPETVNLWSGGLTAAFFLGVLALGMMRARREGVYPFVAVSAALLASFLLWNKVHSPQYTLWLLPFFVLLRVHVGWWIAYTLVDLSVYVGIFRFFYDLGRGRADSLASDLWTTGVSARAVLLCALVPVFLTARAALRPRANRRDGPVVPAPGQPPGRPGGAEGAAPVRPI